MSGSGRPESGAHGRYGRGATNTPCLLTELAWYRLHGVLSSGFPNAYAYRMLASCTALQLARGRLVYA